MFEVCYKKALSYVMIKIKHWEKCRVTIKFKFDGKILLSFFLDYKDIRWSANKKIERGMIQRSISHSNKPIILAARESLRGIK